jgi:hypothetical protein
VPFAWNATAPPNECEWLCRIDAHGPQLERTQRTSRLGGTPVSRLCRLLRGNDAPLIAEPRRARVSHAGARLAPSVQAPARELDRAARVGRWTTITRRMRGAHRWHRAVGALQRAGTSPNRRKRVVNLNSTRLLPGGLRFLHDQSSFHAVHQPLNGAGARQRVPSHLACFISPAIFVRNMVWAEQRQTAPLLFQFLSIQRTIKLCGRGHGAARTALPTALGERCASAPTRPSSPQQCARRCRCCGPNRG